MKEHDGQMARVTQERDESRLAFDALRKDSEARESRVKADLANLEARMERLQIAVKEASAKVVG